MGKKTAAGKTNRKSPTPEGRTHQNVGPLKKPKRGSTSFSPSEMTEKVIPSDFKHGGSKKKKS